MSVASSARLSRQSSESSIHIQNESSPLLNRALKSVDNVLSHQGKAIDYLVKQYRNSQWSQNQLKTSLKILNNSLNDGGKVVISGMGKSFKIANKTVATLNSLSIHSAALHPSEALHGDLVDNFIAICSELNPRGVGYMYQDFKLIQTSKSQILALR
ncbi:unnamed protein product [Ambrosiozyma monospora]|uniref:Unnamed protein product n=1 Tax=Ambrosiozyma monospora TaxID=43982 RepID=A0ACB5T6K9_AMBMO|nr:unnamed protein product [Ambrosiozyma monospora]